MNLLKLFYPLFDSLRLRPVALAALCLLAGEVMAGEVGGLSVWPVAAAVAGVLFIIVARLYGGLRPAAGEWACQLALALFFVSAGMTLGAHSRADFVFSNDECTLKGEVIRVWKADSLTVRLVVEADTFRTPSVAVAGLRAVVDVPTSSAPVRTGALCGMRLRVTGWCRVPYPDALSDFDYLDYLVANGVNAMVVADESRFEPADGLSLPALAGRVNEAFSRSIESSGVSGRNTDFLRALVLADRSGLPPDLRSSFSLSGTSHVLAVSGLHVGLLSAAVSWLLSFFVGRSRASALSVPFVWLYALLAGASPSVVRAAVMFSFLSAEVAIGRRSPSFSSFWTALVVILIADPAAATSIGLWLSFLAVGGLLAVMPVVEPWLSGMGRVRRLVASALVVSVVAQVATLPVLIFSFHSVPLYFWFNNLIVVEPVKWVFVLALLCPVASLASSVGAVVGVSMDSLLSLIISYCGWAAHLPGAYISGIPCGQGLFFSGLAVVCSLFYALRRWEPRRRVFLAVSLVCFAGFAAYGVGERGGGAVDTFNFRGVAGVVVADDGGRALFFVDGVDADAAIGVARAVSVRRGWDEFSVERGTRLCVASLDGRVYAVVNDEVDTVPPCDVCIVNCSVAEMPAGAREYVFTENCETRPIVGNQGTMRKADAE